MTKETESAQSSPFRELIEPFANVIRAPRALMGVNVTYFLEGLCYFGILTLMTMYFSKNVGLSDPQSGFVVSVFTGGITLAMFFFGGLADRWGVRIALAASLGIMFVGRIFLTGAGLAGGSGLWSPMFLVSAFGLFLVVLGYGMYQPASYAAVKRFTTPATASMGYAMLYALNNLGAFLTGLISPPVRSVFGVTGSYSVYTVFTLVGMLLVFVFMTKTAVRSAEAAGTPDAATGPKVRQPFSLVRWVSEHPLRDIRFTFFIFILIPVQTLFAHQWLTLPQYVERAYPGVVSRNMEFFVNLNPLLIFVLTPMIAAFTKNTKVYKMMILGTLVMAAPTFLLSMGTNVVLLFAYIILMSIGEAMWQPRFLQLAAELAPEGKTGQYMGIAQLPWFLTKTLTGTYSGTLLAHYCPATGAQNPQVMWTIHGAIAMVSPIALILAYRWMGHRLEAKG